MNGYAEEYNLLTVAKDFFTKFYLGDILNATSGYKTAVTASRTRIGLTKFRKCGEILKDKCFFF